jgi:hypothetical protein
MPFLCMWHTPTFKQLLKWNQLDLSYTIMLANHLGPVFLLLNRHVVLLMFGILCSYCRGDKSFWSAECKGNFMVDEMEEGEPIIYHPASPMSSPSGGGRIFKLIRSINISNNLMWSYLKCCLRLISCSYRCDHVCRVVAWRLCLLGH